MRNKRKVLLAAAVLMGLSFLKFDLLNPQKVGATHGTIPASVAPQWVRDTVADRCHNAGWNIVQLTWISPQGNSGATSTTVNYGAASVPLQLNRLTYRCQSSAHSYGSTQIVSTSPSIPALNGLIADMPYPGSSNTYSFAVVRTFNYPGPFTSSRNITLNLTVRGTVTYNTGAHYCAVVGSEPRVGTTHQHNFTPQPGFCYTNTNSFSIFVIVRQPPVIQSFSANCSVATVRATTEGGHAYDARLLIDTNGDGVGEDTSILVTNIASGASANLNTTSFRDFGANDFYVRVRDRVNGLTDTTQVVRRVSACLQFSCGQVTSSPASPEPGQQFSMTASFNVVLRSNGAASSVGSNGNSYSWFIHLEVTPGVFARGQIGSGTLGSGVGSISATRTGLTAPNSGVYGANWWVRNVVAGPDLNPPGTCGDPNGVTVVNRPYLQAFTGDVRVCGAPGTIRAFNRGSGAGGYTGSGAQTATFANGSITEFVSAALRTSSPTRPKGLTFANLGAGSPAAEYGGGFASSTCIENYFDPSAVIGALPVGPIGGRQTVYLNGPVTIGNDITYVGGPWNTGNSPYLRLVVNGDIFIAPNVSQLDGDYIATGTIYTCANGAIPTAVYVRDNCQTRLRVFGNFIAPNIRFLRMVGTLIDSAFGQDYNTSQAAEIFIQSPENWFVDPEQGGGSTADPVDSMTGLPPLL